MNFALFLMILFSSAVFVRIQADDAIFFPSDVSELQRKFKEKEVPSCVSGSSHESLCEDDSDYDAEVAKHFQDALQKIDLSDKVSDLLAAIMVDGSQAPRVGDGNDFLEDPLCPAKERLIFPKRGKTQSNDWVFLLNQGNMQQGIKVEECLNHKKFGRIVESGALSCSLYDESGSTSVCRQKFIFRNMLAMNDNGTNIIKESILVPSCCVCRRLKSVASRIGTGIKKRNPFWKPEGSVLFSRDELEGLEQEKFDFGSSILRKRLNNRRQ